VDDNRLTRPAGLDVHGTLENLGKMVVKRSLEPACGGVELWDRGLGQIVSNVIGQCKLPKNISALDVGQALGLVKKNRRAR
jgi:hypothetical protein